MSGGSWEPSTDQQRICATRFLTDFSLHHDFLGGSRIN
jgi:hypothetical protein